MSGKDAEDLERALAELLGSSTKKSGDGAGEEGESMDRLRACETEVNGR